MAATAVVKNGNLVITLPLQAPAASKSGRTMVVASTRGNVETEATVDGKKVIIGVNAYYYQEPK